MYTIGQFAKLINVTTVTLRNWDKNNKLKPVKLESGHRRYTDEHLYKYTNTLQHPNLKEEKINVIYVRESTKKQINSLNEQELKCKEFCLHAGIPINKVYKDFGGALNYNRTEFLKLITDISLNRINKLIIYHKDRLVRFGFDLFKHFSVIYDFEIIVIDDSLTNKSQEQEFADDLISIIHYFSMKLYGSRSYKRKIQQAEDNINEIKKELTTNES